MSTTCPANAACQDSWTLQDSMSMERLSGATPKSVWSLRGTSVSGSKSCLDESRKVLKMPKDDCWNVVYCYSRAQAILDGVLVDVTETAKEIGFRPNTVVTDHLFHGYVEVPSGLEGEGQSVTGRLHGQGNSHQSQFSPAIPSPFPSVTGKKSTGGSSTSPPLVSKIKSL